MGYRLSLFLALLCLAASKWAVVPWSANQLARSLWPSFVVDTPRLLDGIDEDVWTRWERGNMDSQKEPLTVQTLRAEDLATGNLAHIDVTKPILIKDFLNGTEAHGKWTPDWFAESPRGDIEIPFFKDARSFNTVPDGQALLKYVIGNITSSSTGAPGRYSKFGTEFIFRKYPQLLEQLDLRRLHPLLGSGHFEPNLVGKTLTVPVFMARGFAGNSTRTDLHCEPISNIMIMVAGRKKWTLVLPSQSRLLRPQIAPDGRAYFFSRRTPVQTEQALRFVEHYEIETSVGDALWVPTWTWHRVDYLEDTLALSVSMFHFRPLQFFRANPTFAVLAIPNLLKELVGWKTS